MLRLNLIQFFVQSLTLLAGKEPHLLLLLLWKTGKELVGLVLAPRIFIEFSFLQKVMWWPDYGITNGFSRNFSARPKTCKSFRRREKNEFAQKNRKDFLSNRICKLTEQASLASTNGFNWIWPGWCGGQVVSWVGSRQRGPGFDSCSALTF